METDLKSYRSHVRNHPLGYWAKTKMWTCSPTPNPIVNRTNCNPNPAPNTNPNPKLNQNTTYTAPQKAWDHCPTWSQTSPKATINKAQCMGLTLSRETKKYSHSSTSPWRELVAGELWSSSYQSSSWQWASFLVKPIFFNLSRWLWYK